MIMNFVGRTYFRSLHEMKKIISEMTLRDSFLKISGFSYIFVSILVSALSLSCFIQALHAQKVSVNLLTYNIRWANPEDAPNTWDNRKENVFSLIRESNPDVFGLQEALKRQVTDTEMAFAGYTRIGAGRDDGKEAGEYSPIFYKTEKYQLKASGVFWLSQTPGVAGSRGWDAACNRVATWVELQEKNSGTVFLVFCTHFDHMGEVARRNSALLMLNAVDSLAGSKPAVLLGDFNSVPDSEPYHILTDKSNRFHLLDASLLAKNSKGPSFTYTGFRVGGLKGDKIDYIFLKGLQQVDLYQVNQTNNGEYYPSDHLPVSVTVQLF